MRAFISYSHCDEEVVLRLKQHFAQLERDGLVEWFYDRKLLPGDELHGEISDKLDQSDLFLAILSADFIASKYCHDVELKRALERHAEGKLRLVPVIAEACDWQNSVLKNFLAVPKDGKPVRSFTDQNSALHQVVSEIRRIVQVPSPAFKAGATNSLELGDVVPAPATPRYRVKRSFDDVDRFKFRQHSFDVILRFFENALDELGEIDGMSASLRILSDDHFSATVINSGFNRGISHITVFKATEGGSMIGDISWNSSENGSRNSINGWLNIESDEFEQHLSGGNFSASDTKGMSPHDAAQMVWSEFIARAGVVDA